MALTPKVLVSNSSRPVAIGEASKGAGGLSDFVAVSRTLIHRRTHTAAAPAERTGRMGAA
jgi:hypothetical protein